ncbi:MAG: hypothetical protein ACRDXE_07435 [Acidimicrobiales bacterium]
MRRLRSYSIVGNRRHRISPWLHVNLHSVHAPDLRLDWWEEDELAVSLSWGADGTDPVWEVGVRVRLPAWASHPWRAVADWVLPDGHDRPVPEGLAHEEDDEYSALLRAHMAKPIEGTRLIDVSNLPPGGRSFDVAGGAIQIQTGPADDAARQRMLHQAAVEAYYSRRGLLGPGG